MWENVEMFEFSNKNYYNHYHYYTFRLIWAYSRPSEDHTTELTKQDAFKIFSIRVWYEATLNNNFLRNSMNFMRTITSKVLIIDSWNSPNLNINNDYVQLKELNIFIHFYLSIYFAKTLWKSLCMSWKLKVNIFLMS